MLITQRCGFELSIWIWTAAKTSIIVPKPFCQAQLMFDLCADKLLQDSVPILHTTILRCQVVFPGQSQS